MHTAKDYDKALLDPSKVFDSPAEIVRSDGLTVTQKLEVLKSWELDATNLSVAQEENMTGGEPSRLDEVRAAIDKLTRLTKQSEPV